MKLNSWCLSTARVPVPTQYNRMLKNGRHSYHFTTAQGRDSVLRHATDWPWYNEEGKRSGTAKRTKGFHAMAAKQTMLRQCLGSSLVTVMMFIALAAQAKAAEPLRGEWVRYRPDFPDYAIAFNPKSASAMQGAPAAIFYPRDTEEVQWFTRRFRDTYSFSVRSGGHSYEGLSATPCTLTVDSRNLEGIHMDDSDPDRMLIRVGAGTRHDSLYEVLALQDLAVVGASCMDVGFMGCTLGGCHGLLSGAYGLSSDNVVNFDVVLPNSSAVRVSETNYPDLFWALRGAGGGDFGVVTAVQVEAKPLRDVVTYELEWDLDEDVAQSNVVQLIRIWKEWAHAGLPEMTSAVLTCSSDFHCLARGIRADDDEDVVREAVSTLVKRFTIQPLKPTVTVKTEAYISAARRFSDCATDKTVGHKVKSLYYPEAIPADVLQAGVSVLKMGQDLDVAGLGGMTLTKVGFNAPEPEQSTPASLYHQSAFLAELWASWDADASDNVTDAHHEWLQELHAAMAQGSKGACRNYEDLDPQSGSVEFEWQRHAAAQYYAGEDLLRLEEVKSVLDEDGVFKHALTASFESEGLAEFAETCNTSQWPDPPKLLEEDEESLRPTQVLVGVYADYGEDQMADGHLAKAARSLTHVVWHAIAPETGGVNVTEATSVRLLEFVKTVRESNKKARTLLSFGGASVNVSQVWSRVAKSANERSKFAVSVRWLVDRYEMDGVDIDWQHPGEDDRGNFVELLKAVRAELAPHHQLTVDALVTRKAIEEGYRVKDITDIVDYVFLLAYDFQSLADDDLEYLTHLNANLFSVNPALPSGAGGVANWLEAGANREKLVLGIVTYGFSFDTLGEAPNSPGQLDWLLQGRTSALTTRSKQPGIAAWADLHEALTAPWSTWKSVDVPELAGAAAWNEERGVWVGYDSPGIVKQKANWVRAMGMAGGMVWPLHMDAFGPEKPSLVEAFLEELEIELHERSNLLVILSLSVGIPCLLLLCCVVAQIRRWMAIRKLHRGLSGANASPELWGSKIHPHGQGGSGHSIMDERGSSDLEAPTTPLRKASISFASFRTARRSSQASGGGGILGGKRGSMASGRRGSNFSLSSFRSMSSVQSAFDGAMIRGASTEFDQVVARQRLHQSLHTDAALERLPLKELQRKLALLKKVHPDAAHAAAMAKNILPEDGYEAQRGVVRYSRLLHRDAPEWINDPSTDFLSLYETKQRGIIKLMVVVTMYAETPDLLERSLRGVAQGIHQFSTQTAFLRSWDEAVVCIVADGLSKLNPDTAEWLERMGVYSPSLIEDAKKLDEALEGTAPAVALHCFEGLMQLDAQWSPMQTMLVVKQQNAGKLDSQRWAFCGLAERLMPLMPIRLRKPAESSDDWDGTDLGNLTFDELRALDRYLVTVDAGTEPKPGSLVELIKPMRYDPKIAGTCGHMIPDKSLGNLMVMSQVFEYEYGHIIDKSMEVMFGFITVLPGAYSSYRYDSIRRDQWIKGAYRREGPLVDYFKPLLVAVDSPALLNMGLAEDRWLCFALMSAKGKCNHLWYAPRAKAETDVPDSLQGFLQQRRRWNNGAFFTRLFVMRHFLDVFHETGHSFTKKMGCMVQFMIMLTDAVFVWFAAAFFYLWIAFNVEQVGDTTAVNGMGPAFLILYLLAVVAHYDRRVAEIKWVHRGIAFVLALEISFCLAVFAYDQYRETDLYLVVVVAFSLATTFFCALLQGKFLKLLGMLLAYLLMYPTYAVLAQLYGFCHVHDVSWGTKGIETVQSASDKEKEEKVKAALSSFRFRILMAFITTNFALGYAIDFASLQQTLLVPVFFIIVFFNSVRALGSVGFTMVNFLDEALKLTAVGATSREFGPDYQELQVQVQEINVSDALTSNKVYRAIRRRGKLQARVRKEQMRAALNATPEDTAVDLDNEYEAHLNPSDLALTPEPSDHMPRPGEPDPSNANNLSTVILGQIAFDNGQLFDEHGNTTGKTLGPGTVLPRLPVRREDGSPGPSPNPRAATGPIQYFRGLRRPDPQGEVQPSEIVAEPARDVSPSRVEVVAFPDLPEPPEDGDGMNEKL